MDPKPPHFPAKVKNVIYLFMAGGPSQLEMFDYKPRLQEYRRQADSGIAGGRKAIRIHGRVRQGTPEGPRLQAEFKRYGQSGAWVSNLLPNISTIVDDLAFVSGISTDNFNHGPAKCFVNTGSTRFGRPSMGSWITYGIGSESHEPAGFRRAAIGASRTARRRELVVERLSAHGLSGCPVPLRRRSNSRSFQSRRRQRTHQRNTLDALRDLNSIRQKDVGDPEISTRIAAYEMAYRMQSSGPGPDRFREGKQRDAGDVRR